MNTLTIGTRGSKLALVQTGLVAEALRASNSTLEVRVKVISTKGDRMLDVPLSKIGDKGLFVKELEVALLNGEIDLAVHSAKDLPSMLPKGLTLGAFMPRADARDALVLRHTSAGAFKAPLS
jgi:hydroxymethylbilane synthase